MIAPGDRFGRLVLVQLASLVRRRRRWWVKCDCGAPKFLVREDNLLSGNTTSCGCARRKYAIDVPAAESSTYQTWRAMRRRCYDPKNIAYPNYGGRGITVCERWNDPKSGFAAFLEDMGERPVGKTLDRRDVSKGYLKDNCRWATASEQNKNKRKRQYVVDVVEGARESAAYADMEAQAEIEAGAEIPDDVPF